MATPIRNGKKCTEPTTTFPIRITRAHMEILKAVAYADGSTVSGVLRDLVETHVNEGSLTERQHAALRVIRSRTTEESI